MVNRNAEHPPLIAQFTMTRAAPFKDQRFHRPPSQTIGSNFSPAAAHLQLDRLPQVRVAPLPSIPSKRSRMEKPEETGATERPRSPSSQLNEMKRQEAEFRTRICEPSERDVDRLLYYMNDGIPGDMLAEPPDRLWTEVKRLVPERLVTAWKSLHDELLEEIGQGYEMAVRRAIVEYILMDPDERRRLFIGWLLVPHPIYVIRPPVPWHESAVSSAKFCANNLYVPSAMSLALNILWHTKWIPDCAKAFIERRATWCHLLPETAGGSTAKVHKFFASIEALMSLQLRSIVEASIYELTEFLEEYKVWLTCPYLLLLPASRIAKRVSIKLRRDALFETASSSD
ncbi:unnamed protein product [Dibothriocephalus latus]|uniref:Uncharacterized protein n=1 Tax=Dibothriocephalus latus TaxID=60516 RepID=A0A3P7L632_DIBLA|nr:unnamed protein product [Dibothriocephalus latus]